MIKARKKDGYATVVVVLMAVIVISVGLSFVALAKTDADLAQKKSDWIVRYYSLEGELMQDISLMDEALDSKHIKEDEAEFIVSKAEDVLLKSELDFIGCKDDVLEFGLEISEQSDEKPMKMRAVLRKKSGAALEIVELKQLQTNLNYKSFY